MKKFNLIWLLAIVLLALLPSIQAILIDDLTAYFSFDEGSGTKAYNNVSGGDTANFTGSGGAWTSASKLGSSAYNYTNAFDTDTNKFVTHYSLFQKSNITINYWARTNDASQWYMMPVKWDSSGQVFFRSIWGMDGSGANNNISSFMGTGADPRIDTSSLLRNGTYQMITTVIQSRGAGSYNLSLYYNGVLVATDTATPSSISPTDPINIGNRFDGIIDELGFWERALNEAEIQELYNSNIGLAYPFTSSGASPTISFQGQTPVNNTAYYQPITDSFSVNTTTSNFGGTVSQSHYLYNSSGSLIMQNNQSSGQNYTSTFSGLSVGTYYFNATATNTTNSTSSETRTIYFYDLTSGSITSPANNTNTSSQYLNVTWSNATITPSATPVVVSYHELFLYNSTLGFVKRLVNTTNLNLTNWDIYNENLTVGIYYLLLNQTDNQTNTATSTYTQINITTNAILNVTAYTSIGNTPILTFNGWIYDLNTTSNTTYSTTTGQALLNTIRGNQNTIYLTNTTYSQNNTLQNVNITSNLVNLTFYLYTTNTLNITFYDQATPTVILTGPTISADFISTMASYNYTTTNGTMYAILLTPDTYTIRYRSTGYTERVYVFTLTNTTYNTLNLYLLNSTSGTENLTVSVVDQLVTPYTNINVKSLKYDLTSNSYILQEIRSVNSNGQAMFSVTFNDEFYKFIVEDRNTGEVLKTTEPDYISSTSLTIQINRGQDYSEEVVNYGSITASVVFNTATNNFRFEWNDANGITEGVLFTTYLFANNTYTLVNSSTSISASGTLLHSVTAINGTTYSSFAYYLEDGTYKFLTGNSYTYPDPDKEVWGNMGLFAQIMLTLGVSALVFISPVLAMLLSPLTIVIGAYMGWISFGTTLIASYLLVLGFIMAVIVSVKK